MYLVAVTQRTTFGIAGLEAAERFGVTAAALSAIPVIQVAVYAALQIPVGLLVDRLGPRRLLVAGAAIMAVGQLLLVVAPDLGVAIAARVLVGTGDAFTFISVIRILPHWFSGRILAQLSQWVGMIGQFGQLVAAIPFALVLHDLGWEGGFLAAAGLSLVAVIVGVVIVRERGLPAATGPIPVDGLGSRLRTSLSRPGTQLGFWSHMLGGTAPGIMALLWGYPLLTAGLGYGTGTASLVFSLLVVGSILPAPILGYAIAAYPFRRGDLVLGMALLVYGVWAIVLLWPTAPPLWLVATLFFVIGAGGPSSLIGIDYARTFNPSHSVGFASGFVNIGGFLGGFLGMFLVGVVLDLIDVSRVAAGAASDPYAWEAFRLAFLVPFGIAAIAATGVVVTRRRTARIMTRDEGIEITPLWVALFRVGRRGWRRPGGGERPGRRH